jgi:hypothetical protein
MAFFNQSVFALALTGALGCFAQQYEIGGAAGYGIYRNQTVSRGGETADAGFSKGISLSAVAGQHFFRYLSGELRYSYRDNDLKLSSGGTEVRFRGEAHIVHYDAILNARPKGSFVQPFFAFGGGIKIYRGTGHEVEFQALDRLAVLSRTDELKPMLSLGGGVRLRIATHAFLRFDFRDYMTPFPREVVTPAPGARLNGWLHDLTPMVGISAFF